MTQQATKQATQHATQVTQQAHDPRGLREAVPPPRRGLGRGLGALIPTLSDPHSSQDRAPHAPQQPGQDDHQPERRDLGARLAELPVASIRPNPRQPRQVFDEDALTELVASIREVGLLQPVVVRQVGDGGHELVMGERRWRAATRAGLATIPAIVRHTPDDALLRDGLLENLHRAQLNALEEAAAYEQLLTDFGCTHEELASRLGRSRPQISNTLRLLKLSPPVQRRVAAGVLSAGHARTLLAVEDAEAQDRLADRVVAEGISVRGLEELVALGEVSDSRAEAGGGRRRTGSPEAEELASRLGELLGDRLDTRVRIAVGRTRSTITIECASIADLERVVSRIDPTYTAVAGD